MTAKQRAELHREIEAYVSEHGGARLMELMQRGIDRARDEAWAAENAARIRQEEEWYGPKQPDPEPPPRVIAIKRFTDRGHVIEPGSIWPASSQ